ncbi:MAG: GIY-YIG nuclease family protein [Armatimonadota bacterium]
MTKGAYQLHLKLDKSLRIKIGKLGTFLFPAGRYVYTGSALNGLENRLARHFRKCKKLHWHIDYLLKHAWVESVAVVETNQRLECELNRQVLNCPSAKVIVKGFGSSDCNCPSHLVYLGNGESD